MNFIKYFLVTLLVFGVGVPSVGAVDEVPEISVKRIISQKRKAPATKRKSRRTPSKRIRIVDYTENELLPDEIWWRVFYYLVDGRHIGNAAKVSKQFRRVAGHCMKLPLDMFGAKKFITSHSWREIENVVNNTLNGEALALRALLKLDRSQRPLGTKDAYIRSLFESIFGDREKTLFFIVSELSCNNHDFNLSEQLSKLLRAKSNPEVVNLNTHNIIDFENINMEPCSDVEGLKNKLASCIAFLYLNKLRHAGHSSSDSTKKDRFMALGKMLTEEVLSNPQQFVLNDVEVLELTKILGQFWGHNLAILLKKYKDLHGVDPIIYSKHELRREMFQSFFKGVSKVREGLWQRERYYDAVDLLNCLRGVRDFGDSEGLSEFESHGDFLYEAHNLLSKAQIHYVIPLYEQAILLYERAYMDGSSEAGLYLSIFRGFLNDYGEQTGQGVGGGKDGVCD